MPLLFLNIISIILYLLSSLWLIKDLQYKQYKKYILSLAGIAISLHVLIISLDAWQQLQLNFTFFHIGSFISLVICFFLLCASISKPVEQLGILLFPLAALMLGLDYNIDEPSQIIKNNSMAMNSHIVSSITAFSLLTIASVQALLLVIQNNQLKSHHPERFMRALPPLQAMETLLFQMISTGVIFLSFSLITGFLFIEDFFGQHLAHKTLLSLLAWFIFSALLAGQKYYGWRGKTACHLTLYGFICLLLSYFGSKLVLEIILEKT